uniref:Uncharacterized protein n=1 Tax=viral metagenome TaxID=1070528 RepID=A0A6C0I024_9ZZZZ
MEHLEKIKYIYILCGSYFIHIKNRIGAEEARWAHNPKVGGSKPLSDI